jgi:ABC-type Mn2+/Zn2+ transport system ATPase subunit
MIWPVQLKNLKTGYQKQVLLGPLDLQVKEGEFLTLIGPNGSGKTALLKTILGLNPSLSGSVEIFGKDPFRQMTELKGRIGYVPQHGLLNSQIPVTGLEFLELKGQFSSSTFERLLGLMSLSHEILSKPLQSLSGGERQKILIMFALLGEPELICLDEATDGLDAPSMSALFSYLGESVKVNKRTVILVTHDISAVATHSTRVVCLNKAVLFDGSPTSPEFHTCLHNVYGSESVIHNHTHHNH